MSSNSQEMLNLIWKILCALPALNFIRASHFGRVSPEVTGRNLARIIVYAFISICLHVLLLPWIQLDTQGSFYWYIYRLGFTILIALNGGLYYIYRLPFTGRFIFGLRWTPNQGIGTPGFVDPQNKVDTEADIALEAARRNIPIALELQEKELFDTVRLEEEQRRDNPLYSPQDVQRSGYHAYDFLEYVKYRRPRPRPGAEPRVALTDPSEIREVLWWTEGDMLQCHNSFATAPGSNGNLPAPENESVIFTNCVSVERPEQVAPAINLIKQTLRNLPYYTTREPSRNQFKYAVGIDVEFLEFPTEFYRQAAAGARGLGDRSFHQPNGYDIGPDGNIILDGTAPAENVDYHPLREDQHLASCMSIAVDKVLVVNFHILHMIRNIETADQLQQFAAIFEQIIFDTTIIKVWFNPQQDIIVLDATLDEIYRGTPRRQFNDVTGEVPRPALFRPTWKLRLRGDGQRALFGAPRPVQFNFGADTIWGTRCPYGFHNGAVNQYGHPCPCRSNNLDLAVMVEFIMRDVGLEPADDDGIQFDIRAWTETRERCNYNDFEQSLLHGDRTSGLLRLLKSSISVQLAPPEPTYHADDCVEECLQWEEPGPACCRACPNHQLWDAVSQESRARMFRAFSNPSFQTDPVLLGYVAGDVLGISMVLRFLMTTENPRLLLERLRLWSNKPMMGAHNVNFLREPRSPEIPPYVDCKWHTTSRLINSVRLYVDNPSFRRCDMVSWIDDKVLRNSVHRPRRKVEFMEPERMLYYFLEEFWRRHPKIFGEYVVTKIVATPFRRRRRPAEDDQDDGGGNDGDDGGGDGDGGEDGGGGDGDGGEQAEEEVAEPDRWQDEIEAGYVQSQRQFTLDEILMFFDSPSWARISSDMLQMVIGYFELKLMHEYQNDIRRVQTMREQLDECLLGLVGLTPADLEIIAAARDVLVSTEVAGGHNWFTITRDLLTDTARDHAVTGGGLFLKPGEENEYRDNWANRPAEIKALLQSLVTLQALNASRERDFVQRLRPMAAQDSRDTLVTATLLEIVPFTMPALRTLLSRTTRATASSELATTDPILLHWALLVLRYNRPHTRDRSRTLAERFFDITYSPTNFYMPLLRRVVKRATPITRYERSQPGRHYLVVRADNRELQRLRDERAGRIPLKRPPRGDVTMRGAGVPQVIEAPQEERGWGVDGGDAGFDEDDDGGDADDWCNGTGVEQNWDGTDDLPIWDGDEGADEEEEVPEPEEEPPAEDAAEEHPAEDAAGVPPAEDVAEGDGFRGDWNTDLPPPAVTISSLFFDVNDEVTQVVHEVEAFSESESELESDFDGEEDMSVEKAQFLRMLQETLNIWCN